MSSVVQQQISQSLDDISLINASSSSFHNRTLVSPHTSSINLSTLSPIAKSGMNFSFNSTVLQRFTFDYFSERLNINNYKDICRRRDESEVKREELLMKSPIVEYWQMAGWITGRATRFLFDFLARSENAYDRTLNCGLDRHDCNSWRKVKCSWRSKLGLVRRSTKVSRAHGFDQIFSLMFTCIDRLMYWQLLDNEKHIQCSESSSTSAKETNTRDSSTTTTTSLTRTMSRSRSNSFYSETHGSCLVPLESIKEVQCHFDQSRSSLANPSERGPKMSRHVHIVFFVCDD